MKFDVNLEFGEDFEKMNGFKDYTGKLDLFLKRYYQNKAFKGLLVFLGLFLGMALVLGVVQSLTFSPGKVRAVLFYVSAGMLLTVAGTLVFWPWLQSRGVVKRMSRMQAARYLAERFPELGDRLYNILELEASTDADASYSLLQAAIEQISQGFVAYRFEKAVKLRPVLPYVYAFALICIVFFCVALFKPTVMKSTVQVVRYNEEFERAFPFELRIVNASLQVPYEEDFILRVEVEGSRLPEEIHMVEGDRKMLLHREDANHFTHTFKKVRQDVDFFLQTGKYRSGKHSLKVDYKPLLSAMRALLRYPSYTGLKPEAVTHTLDLDVPYGTRIEWELKMDYTLGLQVLFSEDKTQVVSEFRTDASRKPLFAFQKQAFGSFHYTMVPEAQNGMRSDSLRFSVGVRPDAYPRMQVVGLHDSVHPLQTYYQGYISDDYGFHQLVFSMRCVNASTGAQWEKHDTLPLTSAREQNFTYFLDLAQYVLQAGDELTYGFALSDNDPFYPYKTVYSPEETYRKWSREELREKLNAASAGMDRNFSISLQQSRSMQEDFEKLVQDLLSKQQFSWQDRKNVELLIEQQKELRERYQSLSEELRQKREWEAEAGQENTELQEKQRQLQELLDKLLDDKTLEKLQELQSLLEKQAGQDKVMETLEDLKMQQSEMFKDLERNRELYRQMEFELKMEAAVEASHNLVRKGEELKEELAGKNDKALEKDADSLKAKHEELKKDLEALKKDLDDLKKLDESLEKPKGFKTPDTLLRNLEKQMERTSQKMEKGEGGEAKKSHDRTQENLEDLAKDLEGQMQRIEEENEAEDADFIRLLLKGVLRVSLEQEDLMTALEKTRVDEARYADLIRRQSALNVEIRFVADSVRAISKRQPQVAVVTRQALRDLERNSKESLDYLLGMNNVYYQRYSVANSWALTRQQYTMTALNDLALLLSESLDKMQMKMNMKGGSSMSSKKKKGQPQMSCPSPGNGQKPSDMKFPSPQGKPQSGKENGKSLKEMQEALNKQIEALKKMLEEKAGQEAQGQKQSETGKPQNGASGAGGESISDEQISEAFARAAARQEMIRRMMQEKMAQEKASDQAAGLYNSVLGDMERTERDLVNKVLNPQLLQRQKNIETRLLEAENAELRREKDDKRESKQGRKFAPPALDSLPDTPEKNEALREILLRKTPELKPFYREKVREYMF